MFHVVYIINSGHEQFGDFWSCLGIFRKSTNLQKNKKGKIQRGTEAYLAPPSRPTCRPSPATAPASCLAWPGRQAAARRRAQHACPAAARRLAAPLVQLMTGNDPSPSPRPRRHQLLPLAPLPRSPAPWPTPPPPHPRRSRALRQPRAAPPCPGASPPSTPSS